MIPRTASGEQYRLARYALDPDADGVQLTVLADRMGATRSGVAPDTAAQAAGT